MTEQTAESGTERRAAPAESRAELHLMNVTVARVRANANDVSRPHAGWLAAVRTGLVAASEPLSLPATAPFTTRLRGEAQRIGARRAAAIRAVNKQVLDFEPSPVERWRPLGRAFSLLYQREHGSYPSDSSNEAMAGQINALPLLDLESAAVVLNQIITRCGGSGVAVDFRDLAQSLVFWGNGISPTSRRVRSRVVSVFYGSYDE